MSDPTEETRWIWVSQYLRGEASSETVANLERELERDDDFRSAFIDDANLDLGLALLAEAKRSEVAPITPFPKSFSRRRLTIGLGSAAAACLIFGIWLAGITGEEPYAEVVNRIGIQSEVGIGKRLRDEEIHLTGGLLELKTALGARVAIEAPATFQFESAQQLRLLHGRIAASVPASATGFSVLTSTGKAIDLGTEFGVDVPTDGEPEIHVFEGEVIAQSGDGAQQNLLGGDAFSLNSGSGIARELRSAAFVRPDELALLDVGSLDRLQANAETIWKRLQSDPALIAALNFEDTNDLPPGQYQMVQGRFPGTLAPEFVRVGDHMKLDMGEGDEWPTLTLAAWVRLDRLGAPYQSLLHTDDWGREVGQVHWMVTDATTMRLALFGVRSSSSRGGYPNSKVPVLPVQGRWVHLATIYDYQAGTARFYLNGTFDNEVELSVAHPARLGPAQIGNWNQTDRKLSGRIDELIVLGRAMSDQELNELFEAGNPYRK